MTSPITYLSIPYSFDPELSYAIASEITAELISGGSIVLSVVNQYHNVANYLPKEQGTSHEFWMEKDLPILRKCDKMLLVVIGKDGHRLIGQSMGCRDEIREAIIYNIPITYYQYEFKETEF